MQALIKGNFIQNDVITKKDGTKIPIAIILSGRDTVQINKCNFDVQTKKFQEVELLCDIRATQYGLLVQPVQEK